MKTAAMAKKVVLIHGKMKDAASAPTLLSMHLGRRVASFFCLSCIWEIRIYGCDFQIAFTQFGQSFNIHTDVKTQILSTSVQKINQNVQYKFLEICLYTYLDIIIQMFRFEHQKIRATRRILRYLLLNYVILHLYIVFLKPKIMVCKELLYL